MDALLKAAGILAALAVAAVLLLWAAGGWGFDDPDYVRPVYNTDYNSAIGVSNGARLPVIGQPVRVATTNFVEPTCPVGNGDVFNPTGSTSQQVGSGWKVDFMTSHGARSLVLPDSKVHRVAYPGKRTVVAFNSTRVLYYLDRFTDTIGVDKGANGPKGQVLACMRKYDIERVLVGLRYATVFLPGSAAK